MTTAPERGVPPDPIEAMAAALAASNPTLYRHLALYLQVLRQVLPMRVEQACFHLATQVHPQRYAALPAPQRAALHGRILALVQRCSSLLTVEQLTALADQIDRETQLRQRREQQELLERLQAEGESEEADDDASSLERESAEAATQPGFGSSSTGLPAGSIRLDFSLPLSADIGSWRAMGPPSPDLAGFELLGESEGQGPSPLHEPQSRRAQDPGSQKPGSQGSRADDAGAEPTAAQDEPDRSGSGGGDGDPSRFGADAIFLDSADRKLADFDAADIDLTGGAAFDEAAFDEAPFEEAAFEEATFDAEAFEEEAFDEAAFDAALFEAMTSEATDREDSARDARDRDTAAADARSRHLDPDPNPEDEEPAQESLQQRLAQGPDTAEILRIVREAMEDPRDPGRRQPSAPSRPGPSSPWREARLPRDPVTLLRWLEGLDKALLRRLRNLSHALNVELLRVGISRGLLPVSLLDAVLEGQVETMASPSNVLHLQLPFSLRPGQAEVHALAILLRPVDLEMDEPRLRTCRRRLQQQRQELRRMAHQFRRLQRRLQAHEAERLWLQDIRNRQPPQA